MLVNLFPLIHFPERHKFVIYTKKFCCYFHRKTLLFENATIIAGKGIYLLLTVIEVLDLKPTVSPQRTTLGIIGKMLLDAAQDDEKGPF
ncbi:hypothetical protein [Lederbergia citrea]|uniref:hypothetical protein n=1 Tax=Lederbergia citrea TaxID=2833581 RepID=UPI001BC8FC94|nr:hypothetical protein [Lederbergia citrea]MBS4179493.1 hypothetical protein [Lederbergia citrea]